ncbi:MAG TPA: hypothetical protein VGM78_03505 [Ilumatobacteraceae bacterium]
MNEPPRRLVDNGVANALGDTAKSKQISGTPAGTASAGGRSRPADADDAGRTWVGGAAECATHATN